MLVLLINIAMSLNLAQANVPRANEVNIRGHVLIAKKQTYLATDDGKVLELIPRTEVVRTDLLSLAEGDFITGHGDLSPTRAVLDAIEFIGLKRLLGMWIDRDNKLVVNFLDFSSAAVRTFTETEEKQLNYALVPDLRNRWTIFIGDDKNVAVGNLTAHPNMVHIELINSDTGQVEKNIRLQPVRP